MPTANASAPLDFTESDLLGHPHVPPPRRTRTSPGPHRGSAGITAPATVDGARSLLQRYFGHDDLLPAQAQALAALLDGRDLLSIQPTGSGKTLVFVLAGLCIGGLTVVVSPLISLMDDQMRRLSDAGIPARAISSRYTALANEESLKAAEAGLVRFLYIAPERLESSEFRARLARLHVTVLAVDEAHCVSEWGHDFRPSYVSLGEHREVFEGARVVALTATATPEVREDITRILRLEAPSVQVAGFDRPNLIWQVNRASGEDDKIRRILEALDVRDGPAVVYASTRSAVNTITAALRECGIPAVAYHGKLANRGEAQRDFMEGRVHTIVATNAFGLGVDKSDVRTVIHHSFPSSLEAYFQEAGRAGRDGRMAECILLYDPEDRRIHEHLIDASFPTQEAVAAVYAALERAADSGGWFEQPLARIQEGLSGAAAKGLYAAVRVLGQAGVVSNIGVGKAGVRIRLTCDVEATDPALQEPDRFEDLAFLRAISRTLRRSGASSDGDDVLPRAELDRLAGGREAALDRLDRLAAEGMVEWRELDRGTRVLRRGLQPDAIPVDWNGIAALKRTRLRRLNAVEAYAREQGCRRRFLLGYFGETLTNRCSGCDRCATAS